MYCINLESRYFIVQKPNRHIGYQNLALIPIKQLQPHGDYVLTADTQHHNHICLLWMIAYSGQMLSAR